MELPYQDWQILKQVRRFPSCNIITNPSHMILKVFSFTFGIQDFTNFVFDFFVNNNRGWRRSFLFFKWVRGSGFKEGDMEDMVAFYRGGQVQFICMTRDFFNNSKCF